MQLNLKEISHIKDSDTILKNIELVKQLIKSNGLKHGSPKSFQIFENTFIFDIRISFPLST